MIICLLQRPFAIVITVVFFATTLVFGKIEVIGHTLIHAALVVFILEGAGKTYKPPILFHNRLRWKIPFSVVNFVILLFLLLFSYQRVAMAKYQDFVAQLNSTMGVDVTGKINAPSLDMQVHPDPDSGWNIKLLTSNFKFSPAHTGSKHIFGEGHAHLYINDKKVSRIYGDWYYLASLPLGENKLRVTLNTNDHKLYILNNKAIEKELTLSVSKEMKSMAHDM